MLLNVNDQTGWVILSQPNCIFCKRAIDALNKVGVTPAVIDITENSGLRTFLKVQGLQTVPQVYHQGYHVEGFEALEEYLVNLEWIAEKLS